MPVVLTVDQRGSRRTGDAVPEVLALLDDVRMLRRFQRTVGDEVQGVADDPAGVVEVVARLLRDGGWHIGIGVGEVERPLPRDSRAGRGPAYLRARDAVTRAKSAAHRVAVVGGDRYRAEQVETVLWLWAALLERRTDRGWEVADVLDEGVSHADAGTRLGITQSAVTQRARAAGVADDRRARRLAAQLLAALEGAPTTDEEEER